MELESVKKTFLVETNELLVEMENALLALEGSNEDAELVNVLFRSAHTIKGSAGLIGLDRVVYFTHKVESVLERLRQHELKISDGLISVMLKCKDHMAELVQLSCTSDDELPVSIITEGDNIHDTLAPYLLPGHAPAPAATTTASTPDCSIGEYTGDSSFGSSCWHISLRFGRDVLRDGMDPLSFINYLKRYGNIVYLTTLYACLPDIGEMDPESCYLGFEIAFCSDFTKQEIEDVFEFVKESCVIRIIPPHSTAPTYMSLIDELAEDKWRLGEILVKSGAITRRELDEALKKQQSDPEQEKPAIGDILVKEGVVHRDVVEAAVDKQAKLRKPAPSDEGKTIRVDAAKLDSLINLVGELVISSGGIRQHAQTVKDSTLSKSSMLMSRLVNDIRDIAMKMRMVPIAATFNRFQRLVHDTSREIGKSIDLVIKGGDTELDRTMIEKLTDPLTHIVRNSVDHGIEPPQERLDAGKPAKGTITLDAYHDSGSIIIAISDDGRGLNADKIWQKAVKVGIVDPDKRPPDNELYKLIFEPGFSTAEAVTNLSGRGVGMDVVRRNIEVMRGFVQIDTVLGQSTTMLIHLPLTLSIIDGFMVGIRGAFYIIPLDMVVKCFILTEEKREMIEKRGYFDFRGKVIPYIDLAGVFNSNGSARHSDNIVVVQYAGQSVAFAVDRLFGDVQVVIKTLGKVYKDVEGIAGATILGDGTVAMILDVPGIIKTVQNSATKV
ncbi:MAG: chemotaxis protein CheA [Nitrospirae bacterium]|uniref:chemotaxis protein CheA n=1 Tax=Candidatus Magnetobacterium casense TaxID=1455061 RepID=UPI00058EC0B1|nr:chemotaxis protein CheA [Candidatus Magnetobacterium casensis]MBF0338565.1 chemotaxis protein CheA [Nitrospirota bacterium]